MLNTRQKVQKVAEDSRVLHAAECKDSSLGFDAQAFLSRKHVMIVLKL